MKKCSDKRGSYGELISEPGYAAVYNKKNNIKGFNKHGDRDRLYSVSVAPVRTARHKAQCIIDRLSKQESDSHGWSGIGISEFDNKGRGAAINWDLYGYGNDIHDGRYLAVIQVREWKKLYKNGWASIRKNYYLIGTNEDQTVFAHPVPSAVVHSSIKKGRDVVLSVQTWMFGKDYAKLIRQGDVALYPVKTVKGIHACDMMMLFDSHYLYGKIYRDGNKVYVEEPTLDHLTHDKIQAEGCYQVCLARRAKYWEFAMPTAD